MYFSARPQCRMTSLLLWGKRSFGLGMPHAATTAASKPGLATEAVTNNATLVDVIGMLANALVCLIENVVNIFFHCFANCPALE